MFTSFDVNAAFDGGCAMFDFRLLRGPLDNSRHNFVFMILTFCESENLRNVCAHFCCLLGHQKI